MTEVVFHPANSSSGATPRFMRFVVRLRRLLYRDMIADDTYHTLNELPDSLLRDIGLARNEIPFVAGTLASEYRGPTSDQLDRPVGDRGASMRRFPLVILASR